MIPRPLEPHRRVVVFLHWFAGRERAAGLGPVLRQLAAPAGFDVALREFDTARGEGGQDVRALALEH
eukprot:9406270-Lingulodinium_polyedra.AAC.1